MKNALLIALVALTTAISPLYATQSLSFSGPTSWTPGTSIVLSTTDTYSGYQFGSPGLSYWVQVNNSFAPFLTITGLTYHDPFTDGNMIGNFLPISFNSTSGADAGYISTTTANGQSGDLGATSHGGVDIPNGAYHVTDITFAVAPNAPFGSFTLRTTTASPRGSTQFEHTSDDPFAEASFVFNVVPEPSTLALIGLTGLGAGVMAYRRRK